MGLVLGMYPLSQKSTEPGVHSLVPDLMVLPRFAHSQALAPGWDGKSPWQLGAHPAVHILQFL